MPQTINTTQIRDLSNGIIQAIDDRLSPKNCVNFAFNLRFDEILGRATIRTGTALVGEQITDGKSVLGLHQFILSSGTKYTITTVNDATYSKTFRLETGTWTDTGADGQMTVSAKVRYLTYLDTVMMLDGTLAKSSIDGTTWVTTAGNLDIGNCPKGKFVTEWHDRVFVAGVVNYLDRLYYSSVTTAGSVSWTVGNGYIDIEPYHGQGAITGLTKVPGYVLIFKERSLKRWNGSSTFPDDLSNIGSPSQESIVFGKTTAFYFSNSFKESIGFYETNGETTRKISRPIQDIVDAISSSNYTSVAGFSDGEIIMWSIGDIIYDVKSYSNVVVLYHIDTKTWAVLGFPTKFTVFTPYIDGTTLKIIAGNDDGEIIEVLSGVNDNITGKLDTSIIYAIQYHPMDFGMRGNMKELSSLVPYTKNGEDTQVLCRIDEKNDFKEVGFVDDEFESELSEVLKGHTFEFKLTGERKGGLLQILGMDIVNPEIEESIKV